MSTVEDFLSQFLGYDFAPPRCAKFIRGHFVNYNPGKSLTLAFPVLEEYLNPAQTMQGGIISAAFDNVFGPLCLLETKTPMTTTIDINTSYHRPIMEGDTLTITATVTSKGRTKIHMVGEAYNNQNKLIASATTNYIILDQIRKTSSS